MAQVLYFRTPRSHYCKHLYNSYWFSGSCFNLSSMCFPGGLLFSLNLRLSGSHDIFASYGLEPVLLYSSLVLSCRVNSTTNCEIFYLDGKSIIFHYFICSNLAIHSSFSSERDKMDLHGLLEWQWINNKKVIPCELAGVSFICVALFYQPIKTRTAMFL